MRTDVLVTIAGMAAVTFATRASGLWLMGFVTPSPRVEAWLRQLPGTILVAIVAPGVLAVGIPGLVAGVVTVGVALRTHSLVLAMLSGVVVVGVIRLL